MLSKRWPVRKAGSAVAGPAWAGLAAGDVPKGRYNVPKGTFTLACHPAAEATGRFIVGYMPFVQAA